MKKKGVFSLLAILSLSALLGGGYYFMPKSDYSLMHTSLFNIYSKIAAENKLPPPDLAISEVKIEKTGEPKDYFNSYKYSTDITIKNYGSEMKKGEIIIKTPGKPEVSLGETVQLAENEEYLLKNFEIFFDANFNQGEIPIEVELRGKKEQYLKNNSYVVEVFEMPPKIDITPYDVLDGEVPEGADVMFSEDLVVRAADYQEILYKGRIFSYQLIKNSPALMKSDSWRKTENYDGRAGYIYLQKVDPETGSVAISDIWKLSEQRELNRAEFAKIFVEGVGATVDEEGLDYFTDIDIEAWYAPYVQTIYNLGLIESESIFYHPEDLMTRGEALRIVMDYFDADLFSAEEPQYVGGVEEDYELYPYLTALYNSGEGQSFADPFDPEGVATEEFIKHLINVFK